MIDDEADDEELGPGDTDYDLSEAHGYLWEPAHGHEGPIPPWLLTAVAVGVVLALVVPGVIFFLQHA